MHEKFVREIDIVFQFSLVAVESLQRNRQNGGHVLELEKEWIILRFYHTRTHLVSVECCHFLLLSMCPNRSAKSKKNVFVKPLVQQCLQMRGSIMVTVITSNKKSNSIRSRKRRGYPISSGIITRFSSLPLSLLSGSAPVKVRLENLIVWPPRAEYRKVKNSHASCCSVGPAKTRDGFKRRTCCGNLLEISTQQQ